MVTQARLRDGEQRPRFRIIGIEADRALGGSDYDLVAPDVAIIAGNPQLPREQIEVVCIDVVGAPLLKRLLLGRQELDLQRVDDGLRDFVLDREDVSKLAVVALRPDMLTG